MKANILLKNKKYKFRRYTNNPTVKIMPPVGIVAWGPDPLIALQKSWLQYYWSQYNEHDRKIQTFECNLKNGNRLWTAAYRFYEG